MNLIVDLMNMTLAPSCRDAPAIQAIACRSWRAEVEHPALL
jgi:hypothetical protein